MSISQFSLQKGFHSAFSRLEEWFDPSQECSPYESVQPKQSRTDKKQYSFFTKRLSIRM